MPYFHLFCLSPYNCTLCSPSIHFLSLIRVSERLDLSQLSWGGVQPGLVTKQRDRQPFMLAFTFTVHLESPEIIGRACKLHTELELVDLNLGPLLLCHDSPNHHTTVPLMHISLYSVCYVGYYCDCFF